MWSLAGEWVDCVQRARDVDEVWMRCGWDGMGVTEGRVWMMWPRMRMMLNSTGVEILAVKGREGYGPSAGRVKSVLGLFGAHGGEGERVTDRRVRGILGRGKAVAGRVALGPRRLLAQDGQDLRPLVLLPAADLVLLFLVRRGPPRGKEDGSETEGNEQHRHADIWAMGARAKGGAPPPRGPLQWMGDLVRW